MPDTPQADRIKINLDKALDDLLERVATDAFNELVESTPVTSGRLRAGWKMKRGEVDSTVPKLRKGKYAKPKAPQIEPATPGGKNTIYISNGVPYILEVNSGSADRAPTRFVQAAIARALQKTRGG